MARKYQELRSEMSPERRARNKARTDELLAECHFMSSGRLDK